MTTETLEVLARRIAQQESELSTLRKQMSTQVNQLTRQRETLASRLAKIDAEIQTVGAQVEAAPAAVKSPTKPTRKGKGRRGRPAKSGKGAGAKTAGGSLSKTLLDLVKEAGKPLTVAELTELAAARSGPTTSANFRKVVESRVYELTKKGHLARSADKKGYVVGDPKAAKAGKKLGRKPKKAKAEPGTPRPSLRKILLEIFQKEGRTLQVRELGEMVLATGYKTKSKDFNNVMWVALGQIDDIERDPAGGYRLKKAGKA